MMQKSYKLVALLAAALLLNSGYAAAEEGFWSWIGAGTIDGWRGVGVVPVDNKQYKEECGSCHFAYQPGLLPTKSWEKLLTAEALHDHFGEVADLDKDTLQTLRDYVLNNAADKSMHKIAKKITIATDEGQNNTSDISSQDTYSDPISVEGVASQRAVGVFITSLTGTGNTVTLQKSVGSAGTWMDVASYTTDQQVSYNDSLDKQVVFYRLGVKAGGYVKGATRVTLSDFVGTRPLRITEVRYIKRKHNDIPAKMVKDNKDVKSLSYCNACHTKAEKGIFKEDTVSIPNYPDY